MTSREICKLFWIGIIIYGMPFSVFGETVDDPCSGPAALLNMVDRPTVAGRACVVKYRKALLELGYQYQQLTASLAHQQNFPEAELRLGLPANNEFVILLPDYINQSISPHSGFSATTMGIKHEIGYNKHWLGAVEGLFVLPSGSAAFGSKGLGAALDGIISYTFNPYFNLLFMLGVSTETQSSHDGGQRFTSFNPDLVLTYSTNKNLDFYGEIYGQSKTSPGQGSGFNFDGGVIYLLFPCLTMDLEVGQRLNGNLGGFDHYFGAGMAIMF